MPVLDISGLNISFRTKPIKVVSELSLSIERASIFGLAGESGCGKSLTALSIMGILPQVFRAEGRILLNGVDLLSLPKPQMRRLRGKEVGIIFQEPMTSLNPVLRVGYQIAEAIMAHYDISKKEAEERALELLRSVKIPSPEVRLREYPHQLSGGMRQRVMIAMAIACNPSLLIADEPTTALDVTIEAQILELLRGLVESKNMSMLLITHDLGVIKENTSHSAVMYAGRIMEIGPSDIIFSKSRHPYTIGLIESLPTRRGLALRPIPGAVPRPDALPHGCKFSDRCRYVIEDCKKEEPSLSEVSNGHMARCIRAKEIEWEL